MTYFSWNLSTFLIWHIGAIQKGLAGDGVEGCLAPILIVRLTPFRVNYCAGLVLSGPLDPTGHGDGDTHKEELQGKRLVENIQRWGYIIEFILLTSFADMLRWGSVDD